MLIITQRSSDFCLDIYVCKALNESGCYQGIDFSNKDKIKRLEFLPVNLDSFNVFILCETKLVLYVDT